MKKVYKANTEDVTLFEQNNFEKNGLIPLEIRVKSMVNYQ